MTLSTRIPQRTLTSYFDEIGALLGRKERRANFALYATGLLSSLERKSVEPIAALTAGDDPKAAAKQYDHLLNFTANSPWSDDAVRSHAAHYALAEMLGPESLDVWIVDDTGFLKQGDHSVGVQRQYTGTAGKIANCQIAVSLTLATQRVHVPVDMQLYLPKEWLTDVARRAQAGIPDDIAFHTKPEIALGLIRKWVKKGVPTAPVAADSAYGRSQDFRGGLTALGLAYMVGVPSTQTVRQRLGGGKMGAVTSVRELAWSLSPSRYKHVDWAEGTSKTLGSRFAYVRVEVVNRHADEPETQGLLIEWPLGEEEPAHYTLVTLPKKTPLHEVVRKSKARWHVEGSYEDMKGELGLDHYEGRSWLGWNHHVSIALACYALVIACKLRAFPPSATGTMQGGEDEGANDKALRRFVRDRAPRAPDRHAEVAP